MTLLLSFCSARIITICFPQHKLKTEAASVVGPKEGSKYLPSGTEENRKRCRSNAVEDEEGWGISRIDSTTLDIVEWLGDIPNLKMPVEDIRKCFEDNGIDTREVLLALTDKDLEKAGISVLGDRKRILAELQQIRGGKKSRKSQRCSKCHDWKIRGPHGESHVCANTCNNFATCPTQYLEKHPEEKKMRKEQRKAVKAVLVDSQKDGLIQVAAELSKCIAVEPNLSIHTVQITRRNQGTTQLISMNENNTSPHTVNVNERTSSDLIKTTINPASLGSLASIGFNKSLKWETFLQEFLDRRTAELNRDLVGDERLQIIKAAKVQFQLAKEQINRIHQEITLLPFPLSSAPQVNHQPSTSHVSHSVTASSNVHNLPCCAIPRPIMPSVIPQMSIRPHSNINHLHPGIRPSPMQTIATYRITTSACEDHAPPPPKNVYNFIPMLDDDRTSKKVRIEDSHLQRFE